MRRFWGLDGVKLSIGSTYTVARFDLATFSLSSVRDMVFC